MLHPFRYLNYLHILSRLAIGVYLLILFGCSPTKYVPENEYLLNKYSVDYKNRNIKKDEVERVIKQKPNKRILGLKFHLSLYNLANRDKDTRISRWLRTIGEEPVIYDEFQQDKSAEQIEEVFAQNGYFNARVNDTVSFRNKKAKVRYTVKSNKAYRIREVGYTFEDTTIRSVILADTLESLIKKGRRYDIETLQQERNRLERLLKNDGYYTFSKHYVYFEVDSSLQSNQLDIVIGIKKYQQPLSGNRYVKVPHEKFNINKVYVYTNYDPQLALTEPEVYINSLDTTEYQGLYFISSNGDETVKPKVVSQSNYIKQGDLYNLTNVEQTQSHLSSLQVFRLINIQFSETDELADKDAKSLDCVIQLAPFTQQSYTVELEGTNSAGNLGGAVNLLYQHKNLFRGAEILNVKLKGAIEALTEEQFGFRNTLELGAEASLSLPKFLLPFLEAERFVKKYNPKTTFTLAYNYQRRPVYIRTIANASIGYNWRSREFSTHIIRPFDIDAVQIDSIDESFKETIKDTYLESSYQDVLINGINYSYVFNNQNLKRKQDFVFFRLNTEAAGNLLYGINKLFKTEKRDDERYKLFGLEYAQFVKGDVDFRYNQVINEGNDLIYRASLGVAYPFGNSTSIPFTRQFFTGGANGIRAWHVRSLGPGSVGDTLDYYNQTADIKIEANLEYRFKLFWVLEGALFLDIGNIWTIKEDENAVAKYTIDPAYFRWNKFYKDLAVGTGFGLRFDFNFFVFRLDIGMKLRDPKDIYENDIKLDKSKWILGNRGLVADDFVFHIAIGYPF